MSQKKFLCALRNEAGGCDDHANDAETPAPSPSEMQAMFASFNTWRERFAANLVDLGGKLGDGKVIQPDGAVTDGPFVEMKEILGGYMIVSADTIDEAIEIVRACPPVANSDASVEVREIHTL